MANSFRRAVPSLYVRFDLAPKNAAARIPAVIVKPAVQFGRLRGSKLGLMAFLSDTLSNRLREFDAFMQGQRFSSLQ